MILIHFNPELPTAERITETYPEEIQSNVFEAIIDAVVATRIWIIGIHASALSLERISFDLFLCLLPLSSRAIEMRWGWIAKYVPGLFLI
ncbi:hypothetical protein AVEN_44391-1 [Araneus ventricosus]|uniref:Uncharacterized protein n=1 Tax=Araneus ventricosus TaxID=182803 RepID=A0A4Y2K2F1_ARAVE|nr:hypothetical protein AVEN_44391-1 [Araneus ventricosus]